MPSNPTAPLLKKKKKLKDPKYKMLTFEFSKRLLCFFIIKIQCTTQCLDPWNTQQPPKYVAYGGF